MFKLEATLPAIVSVTEKINEPRFPSFKGIMAAKKKEVQTFTLADLGVDPETVGVANSRHPGDRCDPESRRARRARRSSTRARAATRLPPTWSARRSSKSPGHNDFQEKEKWQKYWCSWSTLTVRPRR